MIQTHPRFSKFFHGYRTIQYIPTKLTRGDSEPVLYKRGEKEKKRMNKRKTIKRKNVF